MSKRTTVPSQSPAVDDAAAERQIVIDVVEQLLNDSAPKLAMLILWSEAESIADRGGCTPALQRMAWRGVDLLCRDILHDVEMVFLATGVQRDGFVTLSDHVQGGAR